LSEFRTKTVTLAKDAIRRATITHIAPEVLININIPSTKEQDVYAFGVTMWEILTGRQPFGKS